MFRWQVVYRSEIILRNTALEAVHNSHVSYLLRKRFPVISGSYPPVKLIIEVISEFRAMSVTSLMAKCNVVHAVMTATPTKTILK